MKTTAQKRTGHKFSINGAFALLGTASILGIASIGYADDAYTMAPPIDSSSFQSVADTSDDSASSSVFNWQEVPTNQEVPVTRAVFDRGGYQLYDSAGETIIVPFKNDNLYVMKFAVSDNGKMYFVNTGSAPVLYVPENGYLENATVAGARWYPFTERFHPAEPVFLGIAPSWSEYTAIGWYPDCAFYGGYWGRTSVDIFAPSFGLFISFGGHHFNDWGGYRDYCYDNPAPYRLGWTHPEYYRYAQRPYWGDRHFDGGEHRDFAGHFGDSDHRFGGSDHYDNHQAFQNNDWHGNDSHHFNGADGGHNYYGGRTEQYGGHSSTDNRATNGDHRDFQGTHDFGGDDRSFSQEHGNNAPQSSKHSDASGNVYRLFQGSGTTQYHNYDNGGSIQTSSGSNRRFMDNGGSVQTSSGSNRRFMDNGGSVQTSSGSNHRFMDNGGSIQTSPGSNRRFSDNGQPTRTFSGSDHGFGNSAAVGGTGSHTDSGSFHGGSTSGNTHENYSILRGQSSTTTAHGNWNASQGSVDSHQVSGSTSQGGWRH